MRRTSRLMTASCGILQNRGEMGKASLVPMPASISKTPVGERRIADPLGAGSALRPNREGTGRIARDQSLHCDRGCPLNSSVWLQLHWQDLSKSQARGLQNFDIQGNYLTLDNLDRAIERQPNSPGSLHFTPPDAKK